jgi:hypothetical protein
MAALPAVTGIRVLPDAAVQGRLLKGNMVFENDISRLGRGSNMQLGKTFYILAVGIATAAFCASAFAGFPGFSNPSPTAGGSTSEKANATADKGMYQKIEYVNANKPGPKIIVLPGQIKSANATYTQKVSANNIADFAELELGNANFKVLERADLAPIMNEFQLAYSLGDPAQARKLLGKGKLKNTKWILKFDILKAEPVAEATESFDGGTVGNLVGIFTGGRTGAAASTVGHSVHTGEATGVWIIGMRYKLINAETTEQVASGYFEQKQEVGQKAGGFLGFGSSEKGGLTLDGMTQRLVQEAVYEIDEKYK